MGPLLGLALLGVLAAPGAMPSQDPPPEIAQASGPRGTSGEVHEDGVGYAVPLTAPVEARWANVTIGVGHPTLPPGTPVELTSLETGRTIVAMVVAASGGAPVALSPGAAQALGVGDHAGVRVRSVVTAPQDLQALQAGQAASPRLDAPPTLLAALRRKLPVARAAAVPRPATRPATRPAAVAVRPSAVTPVPAATTPPRAAPAVTRPSPAKLSPAPAHGGLMVQIAALSSSERAAALAKQLGGRVAPLGKLYRVQLGPFVDAASAQRARDGAARRGYADARIFHTD